MRPTYLRNVLFAITCALCCLSGCLFTSTTCFAATPTTDNKAMAAADAAFQQKQWDAAADAYQALSKDNPENGMLWFRLGASLEQLNRQKEALNAYSRALEIGFQPLQSEFRIARLYARNNDTKKELQHLRAFAAFGFFKPVETEPAFDSIRSTTEYAEIKKAADVARYPCRDVHTFDFWVGEFEARSWSDPAGPATGTLSNTRDYEGCVITEHWMGTASMGMSMSFYDANRHSWRMMWNDDSNQSNDLEGSYSDGGMRFTGWILDPKGNKVLTSNVLLNVDPDTIHHIYSTSSDNGKTWSVLSEGRFTRIKH